MTYQQQDKGMADAGSNVAIKLETYEGKEVMQEKEYVVSCQRNNHEPSK